MSRPLATVPADAFCYLAIGADEPAQASAISASPTRRASWSARCRRATCCGCAPRSAIALGDEIEEAHDVAGLGARLGASCRRSRRRCSPKAYPAREIAAMISRELGALTRARRGAGRAADARGRARRAALRLCVRGAGLGRPRRKPARDGPGQCAGVRARRAGRAGGSLVREARRARRRHPARGRRALLQGRRDGEEPAMARLGRDLARAHRALDRPLQSAAISSRSISSSTCCGVHGDAALAETIWREAFDAAKGQAAFAKLLAEAAGRGRARPRPVRPHPHRAGPHRPQEDRAVRHRVGARGRWRSAITSSSARRRRGLPASRRSASAAASDLDALLEAQGTFLDLMAAQQVEDIEHGMPPSNAVAVRRLSRRDRERLRVRARRPSRISTN